MSEWKEGQKWGMGKRKRFDEEEKAWEDREKRTGLCCGYNKRREGWLQWRDGCVVSTDGLVFFVFFLWLLWNPVRLSLQMSEAIDHLTVITQRLHHLLLDTFPPNWSDLHCEHAPGSHCICSAASCLRLSDKLLLLWICIYTEDTCLAAIHTLVVISMSIQTRFFSFFLLFFSITFPSILHVPSLSYLILNEHYCITFPSPHLFRSLPFSWEHPVIVLD